MGSPKYQGKFKDILSQIENFISGVPMSQMGTLEDLKQRRLTDVNTTDLSNWSDEINK